MLELLDTALALHNARKRFAIATVVHTVGSTPQKAGAQALFEAEGTVHGTLGGGCLEAEARRRSLDALDAEQTLLFSLKLDEVHGWDDGLVCGGTVQIFVTPNFQLQLPAYLAAREALNAGRRGVLLTALAHPARTPGEMSWVEATTREGFAGIDAIWAMLDREAAGLVRVPGEMDGEEILFYLESVVPLPRLIIAGAGHIGKALAHLGALSGFSVTVVDDRAMFAHPANLPDAAQVLCGPIAETLISLEPGPRDYVVIVTRGHQHDAAALAACIQAPVAFLGLIGSRRKSLLLRRRLVEEGLATEAQVARVVSPLGLDIGAVTVQEIALSIVAQLVAVRRRQTLTAIPLAIPV